MTSCLKKFNFVFMRLEDFQLKMMVLLLHLISSFSFAVMTLGKDLNSGALFNEPCFLMWQFQPKSVVSITVLIFALLSLLHCDFEIISNHHKKNRPCYLEIMTKFRLSLQPNESSWEKSDNLSWDNVKNKCQKSLFWLLYWSTTNVAYYEDKADWETYILS